MRCMHSCTHFPLPANAPMLCDAALHRALKYPAHPHPRALLHEICFDLTKFLMDHQSGSQEQFVAQLLRKVKTRSFMENVGLASNPGRPRALMALQC